VPCDAQLAPTRGCPRNGKSVRAALINHCPPTRTGRRTAKTNEPGNRPASGSRRARSCTRSGDQTRRDGRRRGRWRTAVANQRHIPCSPPVRAASLPRCLVATAERGSRRTQRTSMFRLYVGQKSQVVRCGSSSSACSTGLPAQRRLRDRRCDDFCRGTLAAGMLRKPSILTLPLAVLRPCVHHRAGIGGDERALRGAWDKLCLSPIRGGFP
jgi:hypothetical protein